MHGDIAFYIVVLATALLGVNAQDIDALPDCGVNCLNAVIATLPQCGSGDHECLCAVEQFGFGLNDCAREACEEDTVSKLASYSESLCSEPSTVSTPSPATAATSAYSGDETIRGTLSSTVSETYTTDLAFSTVASSPSAETLEPAKPSSSDPPSRDENGNDASDLIDDDDDDEQDDSTATVLSTPAKIGIGIGAGVATIGIGLAIFLLCRRHKTNKPRALEISEPIHAGSREHGSGVSATANIRDKNLSDLEVKSKRYEDMVPRQTPRRMA